MECRENQSSPDAVIFLLRDVLIAKDDLVVIVDFRGVGEFYIEKRFDLIHVRGEKHGIFKVGALHEADALREAVRNVIRIDDPCTNEATFLLKVIYKIDDDVRDFSYDVSDFFILTREQLQIIQQFLFVGESV